MMGSIIAFLIFNWDPSEVFMGDTGALVIGMMLAVLAIQFMNANFQLPDSDAYKFQGSIGTTTCFLIVPLVDTLRIVLIRLSKKQSPFKPDKSHIHHSIMRLGLTHGKTTLILGGVQMIYIGLAVAFQQYSDRYVLSGVVIFSLVLSIILDKMILGKLDLKEIEEE